MFDDSEDMTPLKSFAADATVAGSCGADSSVGDLVSLPFDFTNNGFEPAFLVSGISAETPPSAAFVAGFNAILITLGLPGTVCGGPDDALAATVTVEGVVAMFGLSAEGAGVEDWESSPVAGRCES
jgi:hypothetical protein